MKQIFTFLSAIFLTTIVFGQPTLTYDIHALKEGVHNPMTLCEYIEPGLAGTDVVWDFSALVAKKEFTGHINNVLNNPFADANTELEEFGTSFFFKIDNEQILQVGYKSKNGKSTIEYTNPFEKMKFPFAYSDYSSKNFGGVYKLDGAQIGEISGSGSIEADAWGKLILPNNTTYENVLRVKTTKTYTTKFSSSEQNVEIITYRWYNNAHRYPLLVMTEYKNLNSKSTNTSYQAAYNNNAVQVTDIPSYKLDENISVFPNPAEDYLKVSIYSENATSAHLNLYDITGKKVFVNTDYPISQGNNEISLDDEISDLKSGTYLLSITMNNNTVVREISLAR
jgi:hypothetical protein